MLKCCHSEKCIFVERIEEICNDVCIDPEYLLSWSGIGGDDEVRLSNEVARRLAVLLKLAGLTD